MAKKYMESCSTSLIIRYMQTKTIMRHYHIPTQVVTIKKMNDTKCWQWRGATRTFRCCWWERKMVQSLWKIALQLKGKPTSRIQSSHSTFQCLPTTSENIKSIGRLSHGNLYQLHLSWIQTENNPNVYQQVNGLTLCIHTMIYFSSITKNKLLIYNNMDEYKHNYAEWNKPEFLKEHILHDSIYIKF